MATDEYMLDPAEYTKLKNEIKGGSKGLICPKMNLSIGAPCAVCDKVRQLWDVFNNTDDEKYKKAAKNMSATCGYFMNVVFPDNPEKIVLLEIGKKAGDQIIQGVEAKGWIDIAHPKANMGREMLITKSTDGDYNVYSANPDLQKATWDVPQVALDSRYDLTEILDIVKNNSVEPFRVSTIKMDESLRFRILPPVVKGDKKGPMLARVWRHWKNTEAEINGDTPVKVFGLDETLIDDAPAEAAPWDTPKTSPAEEVADSRPAEPEKSEHPACFAMDIAYDTDSEECKNCASMKECARAVLKAAS